MAGKWIGRGGCISENNGRQDPKVCYLSRNWALRILFVSAKIMGWLSSLAAAEDCRERPPWRSVAPEWSMCTRHTERHGGTFPTGPLAPDPTSDG